MHTTVTLPRTLLLLLLLAFLNSCGSEYTSNHQSNGDALVTKLHQAIQQGKWDNLKKVYSPDYLAQNTTEMEQERWQALINKYGPIQEFRLRSQQKDSRLQGEFYIYSYAVHFAHGTISETITVFRSGQDESITISGHHLSEGNG